MLLRLEHTNSDCLYNEAFLSTVDNEYSSHVDKTNWRPVFLLYLEDNSFLNWFLLLLKYGEFIASYANCIAFLTKDADSFEFLANLFCRHKIIADDKAALGLSSESPSLYAFFTQSKDSLIFVASSGNSR